MNKLSKKAETPRSGRKLSTRTLVNLNAMRESVRKSSKKSIKRFSREQSLSIHVLHCKECSSRIFICTHKGSKWSKNSHQLTWQNMLWCVGDPRTRSKSNLNSLIMFGSAMRHISCSLGTSITRTMGSGAHKPWAWCLGGHV